ncbi:hypothetical protein GGF47_006214, partial [Coemansia sp. RSA 2524]
MVNSNHHGSSYTEEGLNHSPSGQSVSGSTAEDPEPDSSQHTENPEPDSSQHAVVITEADPKSAASHAGVPVMNEGSAPPVIDGKESVEFQIGIHVVDMFDILASRAHDARGAGTSRRYQLVHNNPLVRHMRGATANMLRSSPSATTVASSDTELSQQANGEATAGANAVARAGADISLTEVLDSLQYVVDYRLKGRQQPHLDAGLMGRLCDALLLIMALTQGSFLHKRLTDDARSAYFLFGQFIEEVNEFQHCVGQKPPADLRRALKLDKRISDGGPEEEKLALVTIIRL